MSELKRAIEEHKKCPCCDSECVSCGSFIDRNKEEIYIKCNDCGLKLQLAKEYGWEELLKRWNTRKPMERIVERFEDNKMWSELMIYSLTHREREIIKRAIEIVNEEGGTE